MRPATENDQLRLVFDNRHQAGLVSALDAVAHPDLGVSIGEDEQVLLKFLTIDFNKSATVAGDHIVRWAIFLAKLHGFLILSFFILSATEFTS